jgi:hypothetical protein
MQNVAPAKPDLAAHEAAVRLGTDAIVAQLRQRLGVRLVAYIAGASETRAVHQWATGSREIRDPEVAERLRVVYQVVALLVARDSDQVAPAWFQGLNPKLDDRSPARLLRDGELAVVGPQVLAAARTFAAVG